jgi:hypothetical protein
MDLKSKRALAVLGIVVGFCGTVPRAADAPSSDSPTILRVRLTASNELSGVSQRALVNETDAIWRDANVRLRWLTDETNIDTERPLRILVTRRAVTAESTHSWPVGELLRFEDSSAIALASITAALRIVQGDPERQLLDLTAMHQYKLGIVLGRAVAHEIGHYLLQTNDHAEYGLMRASIDAREFADLRTGAFRLDRESQAHLAAARAARNQQGLF